MRDMPPPHREWKGGFLPPEFPSRARPFPRPASSACVHASGRARRRRVAGRSGSDERKEGRKTRERAGRGDRPEPACPPESRSRLSISPQLERAAALDLTRNAVADGRGPPRARAGRREPHATQAWGARRIDSCGRGGLAQAGIQLMTSRAPACLEAGRSRQLVSRGRSSRTGLATGPARKSDKG